MTNFFEIAIGKFLYCFNEKNCPTAKIKSCNRAKLFERIKKSDKQILALKQRIYLFVGLFAFLTPRSIPFQTLIQRTAKHAESVNIQFRFNIPLWRFFPHFQRSVAHRQLFRIYHHRYKSPAGRTIHFYLCSYFSFKKPSSAFLTRYIFQFHHFSSFSLNSIIQYEHLFVKRLIKFVWKKLSLQNSYFVFCIKKAFVCQGKKDSEKH